MKYLLLLLVGFTFLASCEKDPITNNSKDRSISYDVDGTNFSFKADEIALNSIFGIFSISATDGTTSSVENNSISLTWTETPTVKVYTDVSLDFSHKGDFSIEGPDNLMVNVTENSNDYFRATFSFEESNGLQLLWKVTNGKIVYEK